MELRDRGTKNIHPCAFRERELESQIEKFHYLKYPEKSLFGQFLYFFIVGDISTERSNHLQSTYFTFLSRFTFVVAPIEVKNIFCLLRHRGNLRGCHVLILDLEN